MLKQAFRWRGNYHHNTAHHPLYAKLVFGRVDSKEVQHLFHLAMTKTDPVKVCIIGARPKKEQLPSYDRVVYVANLWVLCYYTIGYGAAEGVAKTT